MDFNNDKIKKFLEHFEYITMRDTGQKWLSGGYAEATIEEDDSRDDVYYVDLEWGNQLEGHRHMESYKIPKDKLEAYLGGYITVNETLNYVN